MSRRVSRRRRDRARQGGPERESTSIEVTERPQLLDLGEPKRDLNCMRDTRKLSVGVVGKNAVLTTPNIVSRIVPGLDKWIYDYGMNPPDEVWIWMNIFQDKVEPRFL